MTKPALTGHDGAPEILWPFAFGAAIFDFDGTLADTAQVWDIVDRSFCAEHDIEWDPVLANKLASMGFVDASLWVVETFKIDQTPEQVRAGWLESAKEQYRQLAYLRPGTLEYISALRTAGVPTTLATTNVRDVVDVLKPRIVVEDLFDHVVYGNDVKRNKDFPDIYLEAARRMGVEPSRCLVFEDLPQAIRSAHAAGMTAVGVMSGDPTQLVDEVRAEADYVLESWTDIKLA